MVWESFEEFPECKNINNDICCQYWDVLKSSEKLLSLSVLVKSYTVLKNHDNSALFLLVRLPRS